MVYALQVHLVDLTPSAGLNDNLNSSFHQPHICFLFFLKSGTRSPRPSTFNSLSASQSDVMAKSSSTAWPSSESAHLAESIDFGSRPSSSEDHLDIYPPPYDSWKSHDPRSSSTQSLVPSISDHDEHRRTLLIVYIHGFMGNDSSFRSFPAHVHHYLKAALAETHVIHSKIYPRYKTYKAIDVARENFSKWLEPHESETTDVILIGHSMGGLLAADVVLIVRISLLLVLLFTSLMMISSPRPTQCMDTLFGIASWAASHLTLLSWACILA